LNFDGLFLLRQIPSGWQRNCSSSACGLKKPSEKGGKLKNFDEWTEELSKDVFPQTDQDDRKVLLKADEIFVDDDFEEE
jgi:hypothetical protein